MFAQLFGIWKTVGINKFWLRFMVVWCVCVTKVTVPSKEEVPNEFNIISVQRSFSLSARCVLPFINPILVTGYTMYIV